jgi:hypothetical protein
VRTTTDREERGPLDPNQNIVANPPPSVAAAPPTTERVRGDSTTKIFLGSWAVLALSYLVGLAISDALVPFSQRFGPIGFLTQLGILSLIGLPAIVLYWTAVPCPRNIRLAAEGLVVEFPLRSRLYRWGEIHVTGKQVFLFGQETSWLRKSPWPGHVALNPRQRGRVEAWRKVYGPA